MATNLDKLEPFRLVVRFGPETTRSLMDTRQS